MSTTAGIRARNGNPGVVPPYLAKPASVPGDARDATTGVAHGPRTLASVSVRERSGMQPAANAVMAAAQAQGVHPVPGRSRLTISVPYSFEELERDAARVSDADANAAMVALRDVQKMFSSLGVGARDGNGGELPVYFKPDYPNAAYAQTVDGQEVLIIGNDPKTGKTFARAADVLAHEYTHRVMNTLVGLGHEGEPGTVNESLADTFAAAFDTSNWTIGEAVRDGGLRSMDHPDRPQDALRLPDGRVLTKPAHADGYVHTRLDHGGVHINMGIPNKAATIIGTELGRDQMSRIYMDAIRNYLGPDSGIADEARATYAAAIDRFGARSSEANTVRRAWDTVGLRLRYDG